MISSASVSPSHSSDDADAYCSESEEPEPELEPLWRSACSRSKKLVITLVFFLVV
jgi:hypothetical protein